MIPGRSLTCINKKKLQHTLKNGMTIPAGFLISKLLHRFLSFAMGYTLEMSKEVFITISTITN
jgi:hypothetical protein